MDVSPTDNHRHGSMVGPQDQWCHRSKRHDLPPPPPDCVAGNDLDLKKMDQRVCRTDSATSIRAPREPAIAPQVWRAILGGTRRPPRLAVHGHPTHVYPIPPDIPFAINHPIHNHPRSLEVPIEIQDMLWSNGYSQEAIYSEPPSAMAEQMDFADLPLYAPTTRKTSFTEISAILSPDEAPHIKRWLTDESWYEALLRGSPLKSRPSFTNSLDENDLSKLVGAGIIRKVPKGAQSTKAQCKIFKIPEVAKHRSRFVVEPRAINAAYRQNETMQCPLFSLPSLADIESFVASAPGFESIDFRSYYYQIKIDDKITKYYRIQTNHGEYELCVLAQGACHAVYVAHTIATAIVRRCAQNLTCLTYIDNIYVIHLKLGNVIAVLKARSWGCMWIAFQKLSTFPNPLELRYV